MRRLRPCRALAKPHGMGTIEFGQVRALLPRQTR
jgi:hypothetical protein